jgi:predicted acetyltransferase
MLLGKPTIMDVKLQKLAFEEKVVLHRLMELYDYDFSEITGEDIGNDARFWTEEAFDRFFNRLSSGFHIFLIRVDAKLAGFTIVAEKSFLSGDPQVRDIAEFFVLRRYRKQGVGASAALQVFSMFPGRWEVRQLDENVAAQSFWRKVIARYTKGNFQEYHQQDDRWHGVVQCFHSRDSSCTSG